MTISKFVFSVVSMCSFLFVGSLQTAASTRYQGNILNSICLYLTGNYLKLYLLIFGLWLCQICLNDTLFGEKQNRTEYYDILTVFFSGIGKSCKFTSFPGHNSGHKEIWFHF